MSAYAWFKLCVIALLACNAVLFVLAGTANEALDSAAWFALLVLFELESAFALRLRHAHATAVIRGLRLAAALAIGLAAVGYLRDREWLDAANAWLWIAVVALLELEVRRPRSAAAHRPAFVLTAAALYGGLAAVAAAWAWRGEWFDAYDALLWLVAFVTLELDVLGRAKAAARVQPSGESTAEFGDKV